VRPYIRTLGEILVTLGVIVFLFMAYMIWGTALRESGAQRGFASELHDQWADPATALTALDGLRHLALGQPFAFLQIPAFGSSWQFAIVQGTGLAQLALGPGHVPGTQLPGQVGNFAVAGHRVTAGNPFWNLPRLRPGSLVYVQTRDSRYEYRVTGRPVLVSPGDTAMLAPVPGRPGVRPWRRMITLISCDPAWTGTHRVIVTGILVRAGRS
jgi:sortase A